MNTQSSQPLAGRMKWLFGPCAGIRVSPDAGRGSPGRISPGCWAGVGFRCFLILALAGSAVCVHGQQAPSEEVDFHRAPEAWAMKYFASAMLFTGYGAPKRMEPWETVLSLEFIHLPTLDEEEQRVGFGGSKPEDLNKAPAIIRPRLTIGLPAHFSATFSYAPPLDAFDARAALYAVSLNRPLRETESFRLGARVFGQYSHVRGSFTCPDDHWHEPEYAPFCSGASHDTLGVIVHGIELAMSYRLDGIPGVETDLVTYAGISGQYMDLEFEVDAPRSNPVRRDNRRLYTDGYTWAATAGLSYPVTDRIDLTGGFFYTPLSVQRPGKDRRTETLLHSRVQVSYSF